MSSPPAISPRPAIPAPGVTRSGAPCRTRFGFGVFKTFKLSERFSLRYDAQFFNLFNHPSFSIGIILCKSKNKVVAEYALRDLRKPVGVSE
jgi:YhcG PDDEXK nuclease domain